jgi:hypothetical protein
MFTFLKSTNLRGQKEFFLSKLCETNVKKASGGILLITKMCSEIKPLFYMVTHCVPCQKGKFGLGLEGEYRHKLNFIQFNIKVISSTAENIIILST